jgi:alkanesulfonate monooxygenase SsuD/methylene tetrahydromethanopterin reductase-like flavin-dependent oxidoreductase (luciferase family)
VIAGYDPALVTPAGMTRVARAVEGGGYDALSFSEHPAPSRKWIDAGGHESLDQTSALAFCAAVTSRVRLMTYLLVLPYHNPFLTAKALSTVDLLSAGRLTVVAGTGYLRSEFLALNVDMSQGNELFDESLEVLRGVWAGGPFTYQGGARSGGPAQRDRRPLTIQGHTPQTGFMLRPASAEEHRDHLGQYAGTFLNA